MNILDGYGDFTREFKCVKNECVRNCRHRAHGLSLSVQIMPVVLKSYCSYYYIMVGLDYVYVGLDI